MIVHERAIRAAKSCVPTTASRRKVNIPSAAARSQTSGMARLKALAKSLSDDSLSEETPAPETPSSSNNSVSSEEDLIIHIMAAVREELSQWKSSGIMMDEDEIEDFDLVRFWQVSAAPFHCFRARSTNFPFSIVLLWMSFPFKLQRSHVNEYSRLARKLTVTAGRIWDLS
jgi:hypothetical protein